MTGAVEFAGEVTLGSFRLAARLHVQPGEVVAVLGPNGAGKTTLLRALAGLLPMAAGRLTVSGEPWADVGSGVFRPAEARPIGYVFQNYRLFPHLSVQDNVGFGVRSLGASRAESRRVATEWLDRLGIGELGRRAPRRLSGGQAQRVALARALAVRPDLLLLDEPLAALDAETRVQVRGELRRHLREFAGAALVVTHDALDAMVLADRLIVLDAGRVVQDGPPGEVARRPATAYVARLVGVNLYPGTVADDAVHLAGGGRLVAPRPGAPGTRVLVAVRPSAISVHTERPERASPRNVWPARVDGLELLTDRVRLRTVGPPDALVDVTPDAVASLKLVDGASVWLSAKATEVDVYPAP